MRASERILKGKLRQGRWGRVERGPLRGSKVIRLSVEYLSPGRQLSNVQHCSQWWRPNFQGEDKDTAIPSGLEGLLG